MKNKTNTIKALIVYHYLGAYTELESLIKKEYIMNFDTLEVDYKNRIYFYLGGVGSISTYIQYDTYSLVSDRGKYDKEALLNKLTMNQIIKIERQEKKIKSFQINIKSLLRSRIEFTFCDCCVKLINTRNCMAHEFYNLKIKDKDVIEVLSKEKAEEYIPNWFNDFEYEELDDNMKGILCNYIYLVQIKCLLRNNADSAKAVLNPYIDGS